MTALALPTRRDEDFRYADLAALAPLWPVEPERFVLEADEEAGLAIVHTGADPMVREIELDLAAGAKLALHLLNAGPAYGRFVIKARLGAGAEFTLGAAQLGGAGQVLEVVSEVTHAAPDAVSRQVVRSVAGGRATVNYLGKVLVAKGADGTDGEQSVRSMLLTRTATANNRPELEIHADDVKCAHGCAVGELDANALFYMAQRGLPPEEAKKLMLQAFVAEAFVGAADEHALLEQATAALEAIL
ncbi:MAG: SufD family Fe-S cluster assembly protein [Novosphingobium sp.]|uniref:SufD family Fe-S cluster assembly protein n=1 Tax=Novosphingobium sp. TaxID=1874826 RepID=UPI001D4A66E2|nr:SufD family Fe-S cluster assembly protein [Novosphingobium sp.]MCB2057820.1 SufD family Fe-S cluster assembly protein [Novosphingobium sp.]MCP5387106.1 SufD family Fe-S cluster assembly protein [Novosphingobium sp.]